jgi:hypothetical protein
VNGAAAGAIDTDAAGGGKALPLRRVGHVRPSPRADGGEPAAAPLASTAAAAAAAAAAVAGGERDAWAEGHGGDETTLSDDELRHLILEVAVPRLLLADAPHTRGEVLRQCCRVLGAGAQEHARV